MVLKTTFSIKEPLVASVRNLVPEELDLVPD